MGIMRGLKLTVAGLVAAISVGVAASTASAAFIPWTNSNGSNAFMSWSDGGSTDALWGDPVVSGNTFIFNPTVFRVESNNGIADTVDGLLQVTIDIAPGSQIDGLSINETGFYSLLGIGSVQAGGLLVVKDLDTGIEYSDTLDTNPVFPVANAAAFGGMSGPWSGLMAVQMPDGVTRVTVVVNNNLQALSIAGGGEIPGSTSFIDKKAIDSPITIEVLVPEPTILGLGSVMIGCTLLARRRSK